MTVRNLLRVSFGLAFSALFSIPAVAAAQTPASAGGEQVYRARCASCHDSPGARVPDRAALGRMSADNLRFALTKGSMRSVGAELPAAELDAVVGYLAAGPGASPVAAPGSNRCAERALAANLLDAPHWNGWGVGLSQLRFQPAAMSRLASADIPRLKLKWAFGFPGVRQAYAQPTVVGGRLYVGSAGRKVYSLDAKTGCEHWTFDTEFPVRAAITIGTDAGRWLAFFGDQHATVYAVDAGSGALVWKRRIEEHAAAVITGAPTLSGGTLYVPTSSSEEGVGANPRYQCCTFRGSVTALTASTGVVRWKSYVIPDEPRRIRTNSMGTQLWGPSGAAIWSSPTVDLKRGRVYVTTGDSYSDPAASTSDAFVALDAETGALAWSRQLTANDAYNIGCELPEALRANCPETKGPDFDFGSSPMLIDLPNGRRALVAGQKSGMVHALDPDEDGAVLWQTRVGKGGTLGGVQWGSASDGARVYVAVSDAMPEPVPAGAAGGQPTAFGAPMRLNREIGGGMYALDPATGAVLWTTPHPGCGDTPGCSPSQSAAVTAIPGAAFSGGLDGHLRAYATDTGRIIWDANTTGAHQTVNGVAATGGAIDGPGPVVVDGMVYVNSGYAFIGGAPGNVLLAFSVD